MANRGKFLDKPCLYKACLFTLSLLVIGLSGCATIYNPATGREETVMIDTADEVAMGARLHPQIIADYPLSENESEIRQLERIGAKIAAASDRQDLDYQFFLLKDETVNAFTIPGGYVYVNKGLFDIATEDELAAVLAHEVGHVAARHVAKKLEAYMRYDLLMALAFGGRGKEDLVRGINIATDILIFKPYSRDDERLADRLAVRYTRRAGYNPEAMITMLEKLEKISKEKGGAALDIPILRTHPPASERITLVREEIARQEAPVEPD